MSRFASLILHSLSALSLLCSTVLHAEPENYPATAPVFAVPVADEYVGIIENQIALPRPDLQEVLLLWSSWKSTGLTCLGMPPQPRDSNFPDDPDDPNSFAHLDYDYRVFTQRIDASTGLPKSDPAVVLHTSFCHPTAVPESPSIFLKQFIPKSMSAAWDSESGEYLVALVAGVCQEGLATPDQLAGECDGVGHGNTGVGHPVIGLFVAPDLTSDTIHAGEPFIIENSVDVSKKTATVFVDATHGFATFWSELNDIRARHVRSLGIEQPPARGETAVVMIPIDVPDSRFEDVSVTQPSVAVDRRNGNRMLLAATLVSRKQHNIPVGDGNIDAVYHFRSHIIGRALEPDLQPVAATTSFRISNTQVSYPPDGSGEEILVNPQDVVDPRLGFNPDYTDPFVAHKEDSSLANSPVVVWADDGFLSRFLVLYRGSDKRIVDEEARNHLYEVFARELKACDTNANGLCFRDTGDMRVSDCFERAPGCQDPIPRNGLGATWDSVAKKFVATWGTNFGKVLVRAFSTVGSTADGNVREIASGVNPGFASIATGFGNDGGLAVWAAHATTQTRPVNLHWADLSIAASSPESNAVDANGTFSVQLMVQNHGAEGIAPGSDDTSAWRVHFDGVDALELIDAGGLTGSLDDGLQGSLLFSGTSRTHVIRLRDTGYSGGNLNITLPFRITTSNRHDFNAANDTTEITLSLPEEGTPGEPPPSGEEPPPSGEEPPPSGEEPPPSGEEPPPSGEEPPPSGEEPPPSGEEPPPSGEEPPPSGEEPPPSGEEPPPSGEEPPPSGEEPPPSGEEPPPSGEEPPPSGEEPPPSGEEPPPSGEEPPPSGEEPPPSGEEPPPAEEESKKSSGGGAFGWLFMGLAIFAIRRRHLS